LDSLANQYLHEMSSKEWVKKGKRLPALIAIAERHDKGATFGAVSNLVARMQALGDNKGPVLFDACATTSKQARCTPNIEAKTHKYSFWNWQLADNGKAFR